MVRRVLVLWENPLFFDAVRLLLRQPGVTLVGATSDHEALSDLARSTKPHVVVIEKTGLKNKDEKLALSLLKEELNVIFLSLDDNDLDFYRSHHHTEASVDDLFNLIWEE
jgi:DNA-binding NarL/FixJ family response regulator